MILHNGCCRIQKLFGLSNIIFIGWQILKQLCNSLRDRRKLTLLGIYSNKEMDAVSSYIMYVMNKMELFHNIQLNQVFLPTLLELEDSKGLLTFPGL